MVTVWKIASSLSGRTILCALPSAMALTPPGLQKGDKASSSLRKERFSLIVDTNGDDRADQEIIVAEGWKEISHGGRHAGRRGWIKKETSFFGLGHG